MVAFTDEQVNFIQYIIDKWTPVMLNEYCKNLDKAHLAIAMLRELIFPDMEQNYEVDRPNPKYIVYNFTQQQIDYVISRIDYWYLAWKRIIVERGQTHNLGRIKEILKDSMFDEMRQGKSWEDIPYKEM